MPPMKDMPISISISSCALPVLWELSQIWSSVMQMPGAYGVGQISISICRPVRSAIVSPSIRTLLLLQKPFFFPCLCACPCAQCIFMVSHAMSVSASFRLSTPTIVSTFLPFHSFARLKSSAKFLIDYLSIIICKLLFSSTLRRYKKSPTSNEYRGIIHISIIVENIAS